MGRSSHLMSQVKAIYVGNLNPETVDEHKLRTLFAAYGQVRQA